MRNAGAQHGSGIGQTEEADQIVLVNTVAGNANAPDQGTATVDREAAGENLDTVGRDRTA